MIFSKQGNTNVVTQETVSLIEFVKKLNESYPKLKSDNLILNLFSLKDFTADDLLEFLTLSNQHRANGRSFVIVTDKVGVDDVPDELMVVPSLQEAHDVIEMEEIERDLDF
ncbi:ribonuclease Z [Sungkyunkwania multivorans]|uniref:Ribonuclease Z n=1 Tax=Sungkyunkwania multivorans TaxID=1173618 RepID=A0ABW3CUQ8_9FLAO